MVRQVILCDKCNGHLNIFAQTKPNSGPQYGDTTDSTIFYQCNENPDHMYSYQLSTGDDCSHTPNHVNPNHIKAYEGNLTSAEIQAYIPYFFGTFYPSSNDVAYLKSRMPDFVIRGNRFGINLDIQLHVELPPKELEKVRQVMHDLVYDAAENYLLTAKIPYKLDSEFTDPNKD